MHRSLLSLSTRFTGPGSRPWLPWLMLLSGLGVASSLAACDATLGSAGDADSDAAANLLDGGPNGGLPENNNTDLDRSQECTLDSVSRSPVRRLSHVEFNRTLDDLLPGAGASGRDLAAVEPVHGFENNERAMNPAPLLVEQYNEAAKYAANRVATNRGGSKSAVLGCDPEADGEVACARSFVESFGSRAFRRPLTDDEVGMFHDFFLEKKDLIDFDAALELTLQAFLQSPHFLYRLEFGKGDGEGGSVPLSDWELATRLSYTFWQTMPDQELFDLAASGQLSDDDVYSEQVQRMLDDPRAKKAFGDFHRQWLELDHLFQQRKDGDSFPDWSNNLRDDLFDGSLKFVELLYESGEATQEALLNSRRAMVSPLTAPFYGVEGPGEGWAEATLPEGERGGILTRGAFLAMHARPTNGSPPLRGVAVLDKLLCAEPPEPPPDVDTSLPEQDPDAPKTNRQLFESRTTEAACQGCHLQIDGIGFAFEHYDSTGAFRVEDNGHDVDASGALYDTDVDTEYDDALGMNEALGQSSQVGACMLVNWYRYTQGRDEEGGDWCKVDSLQEAFDESGGDLRAVLEAVAHSYEFKHRTVIE